MTRGINMGELDLSKYKKNANGRIDFSKTFSSVPLPNLCDVQLDSFRWFVNQGVDDVFRDIFPVYSNKDQRAHLYDTDQIAELGIDAGKLVLSPTRTYAPVIKKLLDQLRPQIHGMVHCSGGAQTKVMHFVHNKRVTKNNLFPVPPLFRIIQEQSGTDWSEMYKVFNMGHRMEIYIAPEYAEQVIEISKSFNIDARIVGHVEDADRNELIIESEKGRFTY